MRSNSRSASLGSASTRRHSPRTSSASTALPSFGRRRFRTKPTSTSSAMRRSMVKKATSRTRGPRPVARAVTLGSVRIGEIWVMPPGGGRADQKKVAGARAVSRASAPSRCSGRTCRAHALGPTRGVRGERAAEGQRCASRARALRPFVRPDPIGTSTARPGGRSEVLSGHRLGPRPGIGPRAARRFTFALPGPRIRRYTSRPNAGT
jgi:hypothetical protein